MLLSVNSMSLSEIIGNAMLRVTKTTRNEIAEVMSWLLATLPSLRSLRSRSGVGSSVFSPLPPSAIPSPVHHQLDDLLGGHEAGFHVDVHAAQKRREGHH